MALKPGTQVGPYEITAPLRRELRRIKKIIRPLAASAPGQLPAEIDFRRLKKT